MVRPSRASLSAFRPTALRTPRPSASTPSRRKMVSAAALSFEEAEASSALDFRILDIFDAPSRLGESSRLLVLNAAASSPALRNARTLNAHTAPLRPAVKPLPAPIIFDGPARPRDMPFVTFRTFGARTRSIAGGASRSDASLPAPLPSPILFDGPSQLRPYTRSGAWWGDSRSGRQASSYAMSATPLVLAGALAVVLFGVDFAPSGNSSNSAGSSPLPRSSIA